MENLPALAEGFLGNALPWIIFALWLLSEALPKMPVKSNSVLELVSSSAKKVLGFLKGSK